MKKNEEHQLKFSNSFNGIISQNIKTNSSKILVEEMEKAKEISKIEKHDISEMKDKNILILNKENMNQNNNIKISHIQYFKNNNITKNNNKKKNILPKININNNNTNNNNKSYLISENQEENINILETLPTEPNSYTKDKSISDNETIITNQNESIKRKTITRGEIKNVQITHIICSSKPSKFHITEKLSTENIKSEPIRPINTYRERPIHPGKSSFSSSCQDNIKHKMQNLKGKTIIYQHARGIGMTNDSKGKINPLFYNSEIKKLEPILKKEKEKVEYIENFRSTKTKNDNKKCNSNIKAKFNNDNDNNNNNDNQYQILLILIIIFILIKLI